MPVSSVKRARAFSRIAFSAASPQLENFRVIGSSASAAEASIMVRHRVSRIHISFFIVFFSLFFIFLMYRRPFQAARHIC